MFKQCYPIHVFKIHYFILKTATQSAQPESDATKTNAWTCATQLAVGVTISALWNTTGRDARAIRATWNKGAGANENVGIISSVLWPDLPLVGFQLNGKQPSFGDAITCKKNSNTYSSELIILI